MLEANFWQDKDNSKKVIKKKKLYEDLLNTYNVSIERLSDLNAVSYTHLTLPTSNGV